MTFLDVLKLVCGALIPVILAVSFTCAKKFTIFGKLSKRWQGVIIGVFFGGASVLGTVLGAKLPSGALVNVRDAAPIIAGLIFSGPSGVLAGLIGGGYRALTPLWNEGTAYTVIACSISTSLSGFFAAAFRHLVFDDKRANWYDGFFVGVLVEDFHMMLTILTHTNDLVTVYHTVIKTCAVPMILINSLAVMITIIIVALIEKERIVKMEDARKVSSKVQITLVLSLLVSYIFTSLFSNISIRKVVTTSSEQEAVQTIEDVHNDIDGSVNNMMAKQLNQVAVALENINDIPSYESENDADFEYINEVLFKMIGNYNLSEIDIIGNDGKIKFSTIVDYKGFDMNNPSPDAPQQSKEFVVLETANPGENYIQDFMLNSHNELMKYAGQKFKDLGNDEFCYFQIAVNQEKYKELLEEEIEESAVFRHIKEKGFVKVTDSEGNTISRTENSTTENVDLDKAANDGYAEYYTYLQKVEVKELNEIYYIVAFADAEESDLPSKISFAALSLMEIFVYLLLYCVIYINIKRLVVKKIETVCLGLDEISNGDLSIRINEKDTIEFESLSNNINKTVDTLKDFIEKEANKNQEELAFAKNIQHSVLPAVFPMNDKFEIYASMNTAKSVGGDFYDFYYIDREHVLIEIADVSGKGIPAAMFMMRAKTLLKSLIESGQSLEIAFSEANRMLCEGNDAQMFVTVWGGIVDLTNGHVEFVNAGHNPPVICRGGKFEYLKSRAGFVLAGLDGFKYQKQSFDIKPGDIIYLYTDGVTEATNSNNELYGEDKLIDELTESSYTSQTLCESILDHVHNFVQDAEQSDDITMLAFKLYNVESTNIKVVDAEIKNLTEIIDFIDDLLDRNSATIAAKSQIDVAVDEIFSNIAFYAYPKGQIGKAKVSVIMNENNDEMTIIFEDRGKPYNPLEKEDPDTSLSLEEKSIGGLGIFIVKKTMDSMEYENVNGHNVLTLKKKIH